MVNAGIALSIIGPLLAILLYIIGIIKAWPYRKTDRQKFVEIYKPFKWWGLVIWIGLTIIGMIFVTFNA